MTPNFNITYYGQIAEVSQSIYKGRALYRLHWTDYTLDFLYKNETGWQSLTVLPPSAKKQLGELIEKHLPNSQVSQ